MQFPDGTRCSKLGEGIDLKADGGYVIIPPSRIHEPHHHQPYRWMVKPWEYPIPIAPDWIVRLTDKGQSKICNRSTGLVIPDAHTLETHPGPPEGERRVTLCRLAGLALGMGVDPHTVSLYAEAWAGRCDPPFEEWEKHVQGLVKREREKPNNTPSPCPIPQFVSPTALNELTNSPSPAGVGELVIPRGVSTTGITPDASKGELVSYFTTPDTEKGEPGEVRGEGEDVVQELPHPLTLHPDAYQGVIGKILKAVEPETETHPAAVLVAMLAMVGNAVGAGAWVKVGPRRHHPSLYAAICSRTSGGKGDAYAVAKYIVGKCDLDYTINAIAQGVGSGEGLVERVRDELVTTDKKGEQVILPGSPEKRCLLRLSELSRAFKAGRRESSTLSEMLREAWDGEPISIPNRGSNALVASGYSIGVVGDITPGALNKLLSTGTESVDGYANRFLWVNTDRVRLLPFGGDVSTVDPLLPILRTNILTAKSIGEVVMDEEAKALWVKVYPDLLASADTVPHTDRARPYALRLALIYALADGVKVIGEAHLRAGLAVWEYCRSSAATLFRESTTLPSTPDPLWLVIYNAIVGSPGITRSELVRGCQRIGNADAIGESLQRLKDKGMAYPVGYQNPNGGPKGEKWYPGNGGDGDTVIQNNTPSPSPFPSPPSPSPNPVNELTNSPNPFAGLVVGSEPPVNDEPTELTPPLPHRELVSSFNGLGDTEKVKGEEDVVQQMASWANRINASPRTIEPLPLWMYHVNDCPDPPATGITREWVRDKVILKPQGEGFLATNHLSPEVVDWLIANPDTGRELAMEYAELEAWFDGV